MKRFLLPVLALSLCTSLLAAPALDAEKLEADLARLRSLSRELASMENQMLALNKRVAMKRRGFFTADENDAIESLLFRYLMCRESMWEMVVSYRDTPADGVSSEIRAQAFVLGMNSALKLAYYSSRMVLVYLDEPEVIAKLNEGHPAYDIPPGTYDRLVDSLTKQENLRDIEASWQLFIREAGNPATALYQVSIRDMRYRELIAENYRLQRTSQAQIGEILEKKSILLPDVANWMRHSRLSDVAEGTWKLVDNKLYSAKGRLFENVGHIRRPLASEAELTPRQIQQVRESLRPGDILLTFSNGYMSNIFLPGAFKHGIVFVGTPEQRRELGLDMSVFSGLPERKADYIRDELARKTLPAGEPAELIESVAEGVIYNSLDRILKGYVYRMVVLRPRLSQAERVDALGKVYRLLGSDYDFGFDFDNASYVCCTEMIYRAMHGKSGISFPLTKRMGIPTLSADDIAKYAQGDGKDCFEPILFVDTKKRKGRPSAEVLLGRKASARLDVTMGGKSM
jgi:hypothetical protein